MSSASPDDRRAVPQAPGQAGDRPGEDRDTAVLAARARELARRDPAPPANLLSVLTFSAGGERYAVALDGVLRVERVERVARVPRADRGVVGLFNLHGRPCPLLDVPALLSGAAAPQPRRWAVVLGRRTAELGVAADDVEAGRMERPPRTDAPFQLGLDAEARVLLDAEALLSAHGERAAPTGGPA